MKRNYIVHTRALTLGKEAEQFQQGNFNSLICQQLFSKQELSLKMFSMFDSADTFKAFLNKKRPASCICNKLK